MNINTVLDTLHGIWFITFRVIAAVLMLVNDGGVQQLYDSETISQ